MMSLRFDESPDHKPLTREVTAKIASEAVAPKAINRATPKVALIFALPLVGVALGMQYFKGKIDLLNEGDKLSTRIAAAKLAGFPFSAQELEPPGTSDENNAYVPYKKLFRDPNWRSFAEARQARNFWDLDQATLAPAALKAVQGTKIFSALPNYKSPLDWDEGMNSSFGGYGSPADLTPHLCYAAVYYARHGRSESAVEAVELAIKATKLATSDWSIGVSYEMGAFYSIFRSAAQVAHELRANKSALAQLKKVLTQPVPYADLARLLRAEFYLNFATIRNIQGLQDFQKESGGKYNEEGELIIETPKPPAPVVRDGIPKSEFSQALLSRAIDNFLKVEKARLTSTDLLSAAKAMDAVNRQNRTDSTTYKYLSPAIFNYQELIEITLRAKTYQAIANWTVDIEISHDGTYPTSLPARTHTGLVGDLIYRKTGRGYVVYSTGADNRDQGGWRAIRPPRDLDDTDDFGVQVPMKISPKPKDISYAPGVPGGRPGGPTN